MLHIRLSDIVIDADETWTKYETEDYSITAFTAFLKGLSKAERNTQESANLISDSTDKLELVKNYLNQK